MGANWVIFQLASVQAQGWVPTASHRALLPKDTQLVENLDQALVKGNKAASFPQDLESLGIYKNSLGTSYNLTETMQTQVCHRLIKRDFLIWNNFDRWVGVKTLPHIKKAYTFL